MAVNLGVINSDAFTPNLPTMLRCITCLLLCGMLTSSWAQFVNPRTGASQSAPTKPATTQPTPQRTTPAQTPARRPSTKRPTTRSSSQRSTERTTTQPLTSSDTDYVQIYLTNGSIVKCMWVETTPTEIIYRDTAGTTWRVPRSQVSQVVVTARAPSSTSAVIREQKITTTTAASTTPVAVATVPTKPIPATIVAPASTPTSVASTPTEKSAGKKRTEKVSKADKVSKAEKPPKVEKPKREKAVKVAAEPKPKRERPAPAPKQSRVASTGDAFGEGAKFLEFSVSLDGSRSKVSGAAFPDQTSSALTISPAIRYGVFTRENVAFGGGLQATFANEAPTIEGQRKYTTYSAFAFVRRYLPLNESIALYGEGRLGADYRTDEFTSNTQQVVGEQKTLTPMLRLSGGATVQLGESWWLNGQATIVGVTYNRRTFGPDSQAQANLELIGRNTRSLFTLSLVRFF